MKISLRKALELAVGPANVDAAGHAVADWFNSIDWYATANRVREALQDQPGQPADAVPHSRPDTSLRSELLQKLATHREVLLNLCDRVDRLERRWATEAAGSAVPGSQRLATHPDGTPMISIGKADDLDTIARLAADPEHARAVLADGPAVPDGREPASVVGEPTDAELLELYPLSMTDLDDAFAFARAVLARWGHQPAPPAEGEGEE